MMITKKFQERSVDFYFTIDKYRNNYMSFRKFKTNYYCVVGRHSYATNKLCGDKIFKDSKHLFSCLRSL